MKYLLQHFLAVFCTFAFLKVPAQDDVSYKTPPKNIVDLVLAKPTPSVVLDSKGEWMIILERSGYPPIEELAQPELRIAGLRINGRNYGPSRSPYFTGISLKNIKTKQVFPVADLPKDLKAGSIQWSPGETQFGFIHSDSNNISLYRVSISEKKAYKVNRNPLNVVLGSSFSWAGNNMLVYKTVRQGELKLPGKMRAPKGPVIQESKEKAGASRTYQDLIKDPYDEALFEYYATSMITKNDLKQETVIGVPAVYNSVVPSPDNKYLLTQKVNKPFSYLVPYGGFPATVEILNMNGEPVKTLAINPSREGAPIGFDDVVSFPRNFGWRNDEPATIYYVKALDNGLGKSKAAYRDAVYTTTPDNKDSAKILCKTTMRFGGIIWGDSKMALTYEHLYATRRIRMNALNPETGAVDSLYERSSNDEYTDPGNPVLIKNQFGKSVLWATKNNSELLLTSEGSSPEGSMPFIQSYNVKEKKGQILWRCQAPFYETIIDVIDPEKLIFVTSRESQTDVPNYYIRDLRKKSSTGTPVTDFKHPYPELAGISKQKIFYKRADGISLTADLYLPKGYDSKKDGPLPVLIWAYPREYRNAADAAQVRGSKYTFTRVSYGSPIFWVTQGYAVMDNTEMPIVGEATKEPNDNFIPQLYLNAHAAIQAVAKTGVGDSNRVAVGGHSYGAFMTANLLAHTKLFKAGIARSGAYNRTLTPFGFQAEERTYWEAPEVYYKMSPFSYADRIKIPLLMIHGEADNNPGTFPVQSERLYNAVKGHGGTVRLVLLPYESHGYAAKENILHMLWEQNSWLDRYVKNYKPASATQEKAKAGF